MTKSFVDLLRSRRSIRKYATEPLDPEMVVQLMEAALLAPSSKGKRPCEFILVDDKQKLVALSECKNFGAAMLREASLGIVVCGRMDVSDVWIE
ncbi:MAG: nitroreductase family protein, partial [Bacteroidaceae bacterium]|nr:nitroreductase family protein [Bacteroidaceae bacterium]